MTANAVLDLLFTHPDHRRKGIGSLIMQWGLDRADELGLESYIEATKEGKPCYEAFGFKAIDKNEFRARESTDRERKEVEKHLLPFEWWSMYKPAKA